MLISYELCWNPSLGPRNACFIKGIASAMPKSPNKKRGFDPDKIIRKAMLHNDSPVL